MFGCDAYVRIAEPRVNSKLEPRGELGTFVGYDIKREYCWRIQMPGGRIIVSRDVKFDETAFTAGRDQQKQQRMMENDEAAARQGSDDHAPDNSQSEGDARENSNINSNTMKKRKINDCNSDSNSDDDIDSDSDSDSDRDRDSSSESDVEDSVDKRILRRIAAAEKKERITALQEQQEEKEKAARRSKRQKTQSTQRGLNLDDFGHLAFHLTPTSSQQPIPHHHAHPNVTNSTNLSPTTTFDTGVIRSSDVDIPSSRRNALNGPFAAQWKAAMDAEMSSIHSHGTYELVERPSSDVNIVSCKWVLALKTKDGWVIRFKARLVARGFSQQYGVDYHETYSPVLKYTTLRTLLAITAIQDLTLELMDVQTAYLNAPLNETVYMAQPQGYEQGNRNIVCRLRKAIYGLKQAGREWHTHLNTFVLSLGFTRCITDTCVYVKQSRAGRLMILSTYVDDIPSAFDERDRAEWEEIKKQFNDKYKIKFLGEADWLLNMRIIRDRTNKLLYLQQRAYVESMLEEMNMDECRIVSHPGSQEELSRADCPTSEDEIAFMRRIPYRRVIGLLTYLYRTSRPDIAHSVHLCAQYSENPGAKHWRAVIMILRYLSGTKEYALKFDGKLVSQPIQTATNSTQHNGDSHSVTRSHIASSHPSPSSPFPISLPLTAYTDASWGNCKDTRRSTTGWLLRLGNCWIDWCSEKQDTVALSSCEAEYMAITSITKAIIWTRNLLNEMGIGVCAHGGVSNNTQTTCIYSDNKSAIAMGINDVHHKRSKHIDIRHHFIRDEIGRGRIVLRWIPSGEQVADILTKILPSRIFIHFRDILVKQIPVQQSSHGISQ